MHYYIPCVLQLIGFICLHNTFPSYQICTRATRTASKSKSANENIRHFSANSVEKLWRNDKSVSVIMYKETNEKCKERKMKNEFKMFNPIICNQVFLCPQKMKMKEEILSTRYSYQAIMTIQNSSGNCKFSFH